MTLWEMTAQAAEPHGEAGSPGGPHRVGTRLPSRRTGSRRRRPCSGSHLSRSGYRNGATPGRACKPRLFPIIPTPRQLIALYINHMNSQTNNIGTKVETARTAKKIVTARIRRLSEGERPSSFVKVSDPGSPLIWEAR